MLGTKAGEETGLFPQYTKSESTRGVSNVGHNVQNIEQNSSGNFGRDEIVAGRVPASPDIPQNRQNRFGINRENGHVRYEDLTNILGLRRMDSESFSDIADFVPIKQLAQEIENRASSTVLNKTQEGDGDSGHALKKIVRESIDDRPGTGPPEIPLPRYEKSLSNGFSGSGIVDDSPSGKMKFLCSFGGKILPRPGDGKLRYVGGDTHIISFQKDISWEQLVNKTLGICSQPHTIKYQLPGEDLDALISVSSDEDLQNMIEEFHGLEGHEGSQKLRIFLVPLGESEETSTTEASNVQQNDPDYQYVVALNGIVDPSPKKNAGGKSSTNEVSQSGTSLNIPPPLQNTSSDVSSPLEFRDGINPLNPDGILNDSLNQQRPFRISPTPIQVASSGTGYIQLLGDNSCQGSIESNASFVTAQLNPENSSVSTIDYRYPQQAAVTLLSDSHRHQDNDVGHLKKLNGQYFDNYNPGTEFPTPVYVNPRDGYSDEVFGGTLHKDRMFYSGNPLPFLDDPISQQAKSRGITDDDTSPGIPHAFSDSQLHESGAKSGYCSQEGISQSISLNLEKAQLASVLASGGSQGNIMEGQHGSVFHNPQIQSKIPKVESAEMHKRQDLTFSIYSESLGRNDPINKDSILTGKKYLVPQNDLSGSSFVAKDMQENSFKVERMMISEEKNPTSNPKKDNNVYEGKSTVADMGHLTELHLLDSFPAKNSMQMNREQPCEDTHPSSSGMMGFSLNNLVDKTPSDLLDMSQTPSASKNSALTKGMNGEQGIDFSARNFDLNAPILKCEESSCDMFKLSIAPDSLKSSQIQPSKNQIATPFHDNPTVRSESLYPASLHDDFLPISNLPVDSFDNPSNNISFKRVPSFLDDLITRTDQMVDQFKHDHYASGLSRVENIIAGQSKNSERYNDANRVEPFFVIEDVTDVVPSPSESSVTHTRNVLDDFGSDVSPSHTEVESTIPESDMEDDKDDQTDNFLSDAMIAEMEASIYGLQIIRNADLEELTELGSGTYGTVYHGKWRGTDVAIKRLKKSCFAGRSSEKERLAKDFWREAQILSNLHHPNVVAFYGIVPDGAGGTLATVTEYMVNGSLRHVLVKNNRLLDRRKKLIIAMDAAFGMEYLHSKNIVHFDLKCDNLLVNLRDPQRPICKVGDFGLSRIKRNTLVSGGVRGTLPWMAPELLNGNSSRVSEKVDVFSFGISMWELLTGEEPYADMHCGAIIGGIVKNTLRPPVPQRCDPEWRKLMEECWSPDPESRPSFTEITNRLRSMSMALQTKGTYQAWQLRPSNAP